MSIAAIDKLFERLYITYGAEWERSMGNLPIADVKTHWAYELAPYLQSKERMQAIAWALGNLPERCPNVVTFKNLCMKAPMPDAPLLPLPKADPDRVAAELAKLGALRDKPAAASDGREWARRILTNHRGGLRVNPTVLQMAKSAVQE